MFAVVADIVVVVVAIAMFAIVATVATVAVDIVYRCILFSPVAVFQR